MKFPLSTALLGALLVFVSSPAQAADSVFAVNQAVPAPVYHVKGVIKSISPHALTLSHDAVPELQWPPMTMPFALAKNLELPALSVNDPVDFDVSLLDGRYEIIALTVRH
ncbi:copper-binding protein [Scandinavium sp. TWS1a]|uniref:copper-binding protein n=1 Tax=Scandinavium tedordense TaxID=2926521 RepID=UPI002165002C|nr:copper-binding protein [Scandinavium tedordense]MCS2172009.1 copper-binding protein [Scandinavium tedordense]